ncbi:MAG: transporter substrate-binding domain-containing protein [Alkalimonas sp.]|nr:transporter substrate-binding domain-containing protein [Alkalimonas sp.]
MVRIGSLLLTLLCTVQLAADEQPELKWCLDDHWHYYDENTDLQGPTVSLMHIIADRVGFTLHHSEITPFTRCLRMMELGQTDLMASLNYSDERNRYMHFIPYDDAKPEVIYLLQDAEDIHQWDHIRPKTIGILKEYAYTPELQQRLTDNSLNLLEAATLEEAFALLLFQEVDAIIGPAQSSANVIRHTPRFHQKFKPASYQFDFNEARSINFTFSRSSPHQELLPKLQQVVQQMVESGEIKQFRTEINAVD